MTNTDLVRGWNHIDPNRDYHYIPAADVFLLVATHGLPLDVVRDMAFEKGMLIDELGFRRLMDEHRERSRPKSLHGRKGLQLA